MGFAKSNINTSVLKLQTKIKLENISILINIIFYTKQITELRRSVILY